MKNKTILTIFIILLLSQIAVADIIKVNNGTKFTNNTNISLNVSVDGQDYGWVYFNATNTTGYGIDVFTGANITANTSTNWILNTTSPMDGVRWLWLKNSSNGAYTANTSIILDTTYPTIDILTPSNGSVYFPDEINMLDYSISATDYNFTQPNDTIPYNVTPSTLIRTIGKHQITVTTTDNASNTVTKSINYTVVERVESSGSITRTLNSSSMYPGGTILINLTSNGSNFFVYIINETIPSQFNFTFLGNSSKINITTTVNGDNMVYTFVGMGAFTNLSYSINTTNTTYKSYSIYGDFIDEDRKHGSISATNFNLFKGDDIKIYQQYDTNSNNKIEKSELINAVWDFFNKPQQMNLSDVVKLIIKCLTGGTW